MAALTLSTNPPAAGDALTEQDKTDIRAGLGLGTAATTDATAYATAAQGTAADAHAASTSNPHSVTKTQVGLGSVDNTADADKPISTATAAALAGKETAGAAAAAIAAHVAAADPHNVYELKSALGTAAYTAVTAYATSAQGANADSAMQPPSVTALVSGKTLTNADSGNTFTTASSQVITVNTGLSATYAGNIFDGPVTFAGTATVTDSRASGFAFEQCALVRIGADTYRVTGAKA